MSDTPAEPDPLQLPQPRDAEARERPFAFLRHLKGIVPYVRRHKRLCAASLALMGLGAATSLVVPWPLAILIDTVLGHKPLPALLGPIDGAGRNALLILAVSAGFVVTGVQYGIGVVQNYVETKLEQSLLLDFRSDLFQHAHALSLAYHDQQKTGNFMFQITGESYTLGAIAVSIPPLLQSILTLVGMFVVAMLIDPELALVSLVVVPLIYYGAGYYLRRIEPEIIRVRTLEGETMQIINEAMALLRVVIAFGREGHEYGRFRRQGETAARARVNLTVRQTLFSLGVDMITAGGTAAVLGIGAHHVLQHRLTVGELLVLMGYIAAIYQPLQQISSIVGSLQTQLVNFRWVLDMLEIEPDIQDAPDAVTIHRASGDVRFEGVHFAYLGRERTLSDVSLHVAPGERLGIVGATGAGKTTLVNLIPRFYEVGAGAVYLDGIDIRRLTIRSLREQIALVMQDPLLFSDTIYENIRYGRLDATAAEIEEAARAASAHEFISGLPKGYETTAGERGVRLSGGERQRISIARAFLRNAPILILDEPTSAVDTKTEQEILDALERLMEGRTTLIVAHRLSTLRTVDAIAVVADGRIVERGTHEELLELGGQYRSLWDLQHRRSPPRLAPPEAVTEVVA